MASKLRFNILIIIYTCDMLMPHNKRKHYKAPGRLASNLRFNIFIIIYMLNAKSTPPPPSQKILPGGT